MIPSPAHRDETFQMVLERGQRIQFERELDSIYAVWIDKEGELRKVRLTESDLPWIQEQVQEGRIKLSYGIARFFGGLPDDPPE